MGFLADFGEISEFYGKINKIVGKQDQKGRKNLCFDVKFKFIIITWLKVETFDGEK